MDGLLLFLLGLYILWLAGSGNLGRAIQAVQKFGQDTTAAGEAHGIIPKGSSGTTSGMIPGVTDAGLTAPAIPGPPKVAAPSFDWRPSSGV